MKKLLIGGLIWLAAFPAFAQTVAYKHIDPASGVAVSVNVDDSTHPLPTTGSGGGGGSGGGTTGAAVPSTAVQVAGKNPAGNLTALCTSTDGVLCAPQASTRTLTATNLTVNTDTVVCPTATNPVVTEIFFTTAGVGIGVNGQTLTTATPGTTTTNSPDISIGTAGTLYTFPVGPSNAIHAYGAAGVVRCIQTLRQ